jgi:hypothetical protein
MLQFFIMMVMTIMTLLYFGKNNNYQLVYKQKQLHRVHTGVNIPKVSSYVTQSTLKHLSFPSVHMNS